MIMNPSFEYEDLVVDPKIKAPSKLLLLTEGARATVGLGLYALTNRFLKNVPKGDGHPVLVVPGFMTSDFSTTILRKYLKDIGYEVMTWGMGVNLGRPEYAERLLERVVEINAMTDRKVSIVGWSLGGVFAREVARTQPNLIRQVITLGSPFAGLFGDNNARWFYDFLHGQKGMEMANEMVKDILETPSVPITAIYSKEDGIVPWQYCMEQEENATT
ncbi:MAG: lipase family alpha/beta hydrolase, partial [Saprospiraceae bacterium]